MKDYDNWNTKLEFDYPKSDIIYMAKALSRTCDIVITTAKSDKYLEITLDWLHKNIPFEFRLVMRKEGDKRPSTEVKQEFAEHIWSKGKRILLAIDDREDICQMYKGILIETLQVK